MSSKSQANAAVIDRLVEAYNAQDARGFADLFTEDGWHGDLHAERFQQGREEIYRRYVDVFALYPENRTDVVHRIAFGPFVVDHEHVRRSNGAEPFEVVAIYTLEDGLIKRAELVRA